MAKSKPAPPIASVGKVVASKVKDGRVTKTELTKPAENTAKMAKALEKKVKDDDSSDDDESSGSDSKSGDSSHGIKSTSKTKTKSKSSESSSSESSSSESESEGQDKKKATKPVKVQKMTNGDAPASASDGSVSDDEDASDAEEVPPKPKKVVSSANVTNGKVKAKKSSDDSGSSDSESESGSESGSGNSDDDGSSSGSGSDSEDSDSKSDKESKAKQDEKLADAPPQKRKAEDIDVANKKPKAASQAIKNLFVGNLSFNVDDEWLMREFAEYGEVTGARIVNDRESGRSRGFGYVDFANSEDAEKALFAMRGGSIDGRPLNIDYATPKSNNAAQDAHPRARADSRAQKYGDAKSSPSDTLWVGNIPFSADSDSLREIFEEQGTVLSVRIPTDPETQAIKGFGYVSFSSVDEATAALEALNGVQLSGRSLRLDFAPPRDNNRNTGGSRGRFSDGNWRGGSSRGGGGSPRGGGDRGGFRGGDRGGFRGGRGGFRGGRGGSSFGGAGNFQSTRPAGTKTTFD